MVSFRFPFSFSQPPRPPVSAAANASSWPFSATTAALSVTATLSVAGAGIAISQNPDNSLLQSALNFMVSKKNSFSPMWGSLSLSENASPVTESRTGMSFPVVLGDSQRLLGVGVRRKAILGLKNIDVYAFGVYADDADVIKFLSEKYKDLSASELKEKEELKEDLMECDVSMTIRLQIVYGRLSIRSVRSAFEDSVGSRLQKFGGSDTKELLQRFTSQFKDEYKIPKGSIIDLSREQGYVLRTINMVKCKKMKFRRQSAAKNALKKLTSSARNKISMDCSTGDVDGNEAGSIQSKLLCRSILDLYIGDEPFDQKAKEDVKLNLASLLGK